MSWWCYPPSRAGRSFLFLGVLAAAVLAAACGDDKDPDEGDFDRWDACERLVSLCEDERAAIESCVDRLEQSFPDRDARTAVVLCMKEAATCEGIQSCENRQEETGTP
ncbi:MAG: hypothetical protein AB1640_04940 [bacterium]